VGAAAPAAPSENGPELDSQPKVRERMFAFSAVFWIENGRNQRVIRVDGKGLRVRDTLLLQTLMGRSAIGSRRRWFSGTR
jgi:uncharacterized protein YxjI